MHATDADRIAELQARVRSMTEVAAYDLQTVLHLREELRRVRAVLFAIVEATGEVRVSGKAVADLLGLHDNVRLLEREDPGTLDLCLRVIRT
jgi:hypothetical protein